MSKKFDGYLQETLGSLNELIASDPGYSKLSHFHKGSLPDIFALLSGKPFGSRAVAESVEVTKFRNNVLFRGSKLSDIVSFTLEGAGAAKAEDLIIAAGASRGITISRDEASEIVRLLETGAFFQDAGSSLAAVLEAFPKVPMQILTEAPLLSPLLFRALLLDSAEIAGNPIEAAMIANHLLQDLRDGSFDSPPAVMTHTLREISRSTSLKAGLTTIQQVYAKENRSIRLATILYARSRGVDLTEQDIDSALSGPLNPNSPDLEAAILQAAKRLRGI